MGWVWCGWNQGEKKGSFFGGRWWLGFCSVRKTERQNQEQLVQSGKAEIGEAERNGRESGLVISRRAPVEVAGQENKRI